MENNNTLVSIIVPVYNAAAWIEATIRSVREQTYTNWELLLVNDCSKDNSYEVIKAAAETDARIRVFSNSVNSKAWETRNVGLRNAKGRYIAFLDADDLWHHDKLQKQLQFMQQNNYAFTYTGFRRFSGAPSETDKVIQVAERVSASKLLTNTIIATSTVVIDRDVTGAFEMQDVYYDDLVLWVTLLKRIPFAYGLNECLMDYRIASNSLSRNKWNSAKKVYSIYNKNLGLNFIQARYYFAMWCMNSLMRYALRY